MQGRRFWHPLHAQAPYARPEQEFPIAAARRAIRSGSVGVHDVRLRRRRSVRRHQGLFLHRPAGVGGGGVSAAKLPRHRRDRILGSALVRRLVRDGYRVRVLDNHSRGVVSRLADVVGMFEMIEGDVRDGEAVLRAARGVDGIIHLAFVNGTGSFYTKPDVVLDVGVRGMLSVIDAGARLGISDLILASSSEVYQTPPQVPTDEDVPLAIPDVLNPRIATPAER
jgi:hypothetical protein